MKYVIRWKWIDSAPIEYQQSAVQLREMQVINRPALKQVYIISGAGEDYHYAPVEIISVNDKLVPEQCLINTTFLTVDSSTYYKSKAAIYVRSNCELKDFELVQIP